MSFKIELDHRGNPIGPKPVFEEVSGGEFIPGVGVVASEKQIQSAMPQEPEEQPEQHDTQGQHDIEQEPQEEVEEAPVKKLKPRSAAGEENFRTIRQRADKERQRAEKAEQELEMLRRVQQQAPQYQPYYPPQQQQQYVPAEEEVDLNFGDDDLIEGKTLKKIVNNLANQLKSSHQRSQKEIQAAQQASSLLALRSKYPDLDSVVSEENMRDLEAQQPLLAQSIFSAPTIESRYVTAYTMIKNLGIYEEDPYVEQKERVKKNLAKPRSGIASAPASPMAGASDYYNGPITAEIAARARKQVEDAKRNR